MALYMLSTDIATNLIRGKSRTLDERIALVSPEDLCMSAVTRGELLLGVSRQTLQATGGEPAPVIPARREVLQGQGKVRDALKRADKARAVASTIDPATMASVRKTTHAVLAKLTTQEAKSLRMRFGINLSKEHTLEKISKQFEATRERIRSRERAHNLSSVVDQFLTRVPCLPWDAVAATHFANVAIELHQVGAPLGTTDTMIAGHAIAVGAILVTNSEQRFSRVGGLKTEDWTRRRSTQ